MVEVRWPGETIDQLNAIAAYIAQFDPGAALQMRTRLFDLGESLALFPRRGRPAADGTREMVTVPPYVLTYELHDDVAVILNIRHGRRRPHR